MDSPHEAEAKGLGDLCFQIHLIVFKSIPDGPYMHEVITVVPKQHLQQPSAVVEDSDHP